MASASATTTADLQDDIRQHLSADTLNELKIIEEEKEKVEALKLEIIDKENEIKRINNEIERLNDEQLQLTVRQNDLRNQQEQFETIIKQLENVLKEKEANLYRLQLEMDKYKENILILNQRLDNIKKCPRCRENYIPSDVRNDSCHYHNGFIVDVGRPNENLTQDQALERVQRSKLANDSSINNTPKLMWSCSLRLYVEQGCNVGKCGLSLELDGADEKIKNFLNGLKQQLLLLLFPLPSLNQILSKQRRIRIN
ncbi:unnamed protein product [Didymodactylos carnosus]|uniref:Uncharacterized protein n=1 Tax=Didymodactylos carnosus TaxID=1234261 RepID=A0A8S2D628_9BILA|nr:unnamed protein product [Didymodactylos carnosus]CAF3637491.1 unnamed protein product [Didymodactylos carnosus]